MANELIITEEQTENPIPSDKPAHIQWHPGYVSAIKMEFKDDKNDYCFGSAWKVGLVLVSTEVWKLEKPSVAGHYVKSSN